MSLNISMPSHEELKPRITVFGVGGAGGNAVNNMITQNLEGVEFVVANTDSQALAQSLSTNRLQLGEKQTEGLGAGAKASVGAAAAEESIEQIIDHLAGAHMCFITAGMGGGTGTGAAPIIAQAARELGVLTIGVVTKPFQFEGVKRMRQADDGVEELQKVVDTLIIIPNQNLFRLANERTTFTEAFSMADDVLYQGVKGVTDLMVRPGLINLDFADVRAVMDEMGKAMMGTGEHEGEDRAVRAAQNAIENPLLDDTSLRGAKGVLINITGGYDLTLFEVDEAANRIREEVDPDANIIVGSTLDPDMSGFMRVSVVATGIDVDAEAEVRAPMSSSKTSVAPAPSQTYEEDTGDIAQADVPPPAYRPVDDTVAEPAAIDPIQPAAAAPQSAQNAPSSDDLNRLSGALNASTTPGGQPEPARPAAAAPQQPAFLAQRAASLAASQQQQAAAAPSPEAHDPQQPAQRFGFNSLINRLTSSEDAAGKPAAPTAPAAPRVADAPAKAEKSDVEVPSFLRRQAP